MSAVGRMQTCRLTTQIRHEAEYVQRAVQKNTGPEGPPQSLLVFYLKWSTWISLKSTTTHGRVLYLRKKIGGIP